MSPYRTAPPPKPRPLDGIDEYERKIRRSAERRENVIGTAKLLWVMILMIAAVAGAAYLIVRAANPDCDDHRIDSGHVLRVCHHPRGDRVEVIAAPEGSQ